MHKLLDEAQLPLCEASRLLGVPVRTLRRWCNCGALPSVVLGHRRIPRAVIERLLRGETLSTPQSAEAER